jgi:ribose-phosphate pyrophosphokinase
LLAARLADELECTLATTDLRDFPDGETYARIASEVAHHDVIIVQATRTNRDIVELLLLLDAAHEAGSVKVNAVLPYYGYARQDRAFETGEAVSARAVARALYATANEMFIVDPHKRHILDFFPGVSHGVTAVPQLCEKLRAWQTDLVLAPDAGATERAANAARILGVPYDRLTKKRLSSTEVKTTARDLDVDGRRVAIVDDMIASGGTMAAAARQLLDQGAASVAAACTHGIFTPGALGRLRDAGIAHVLCTDTVEGNDCDVVSAAPAIAQVMQRAVLV